MKKAIVVGSGFGGIASALRLRAKKQYIKKSERLRIQKQKAVYSDIILRDSE
mgnify:CR=1 FL=1